MREKIKNSKATTKVLSVVLAVVLWLVLEYTDNPQITRRINNVDITFRGVDALKEKGLIPINLEKSSHIDVEIKGSRMGIIKAMSNITATADLSSVSVKGTRIENVKVETGVAGVYVEGNANSTISVEIDEIGEKTVPVEIVYTGAEKNKQTIVVANAQKESIVLSGAKSELERIERAVISIATHEIDKRTTKDIQYVLYDVDGDKHIPDTVRADTQAITVTSGLYPRKSIPVKVVLEEKYEKAYTTDIKIKSKENVDVGLVSLDSNIEELRVEFDPDMYEEGKNEYELLIDVPEGIYIRSEAKKVVAEIVMKKKSSEKLVLDVEIKNIKAGLKPERDSYKAIIEVSGPENEIDRSRIKAYADADGLSEGEHEVSVHIEGAERVVQLNKEKIKIKLIKQEG